MRYQVSEEERLTRKLKVQAVIFWVLSGISGIITLIFLISGFNMDSEFFEHPFEAFFTDEHYTSEWEETHFGFFLFFLTNTILRFYNGICLSQIKFKAFSIFMAAYTLLVFPVGTVIGIISLVVLSKSGMNDVYEKAEEKRVVDSYMSMKDY